jgi:hypothetical protein
MNPSDINERFAALERDIKRANRRAQTAYILAAFGAIASFSLGYHKEAIAQGYGVTLAQLATRMTAVETKTQFITTDGNATTGGNMYFTRANLHVRSGSGFTTGAVNGLGNLILGYNEVSGASGDERRGSHNLVIGSFHDYTSYAGFVGGTNNRITGSFACVITGERNQATGVQAAVLTGYENAANRTGGAILSGTNHTVSGNDACVVGGISNIASGERSVVGGGANRSVTGNDDWRAGTLFQDF